MSLDNVLYYIVPKIYMAKDYNHILVDTGPQKTSLNKGKEISGFKTNCVV